MKAVPLAFLGGGSSLPLLSVLLWASLVVSTIAMLVLMRTNWGRERPTHRYAMLSIVAHLLLICVATTIRFAIAPVGDGPAPVKVRIVMHAPKTTAPVEEEPQPENAAAPEANTEAIEPQQEETTEHAAAPPLLEPPRAPEQETTPPYKPAPARSPASDEPPTADAPPLVTNPEPSPPEPEPAVPVERLVALPVEPAQQPQPKPQPPGPVIETSPSKPAPVALSARDGEQRLRRLFEEGGDSRTEDAVASALAWLAAAQTPHGRWDADRWAAGRERRNVLGHDRTGVGMRADAAMTGLSLLALMGAGHTHMDGPFADTIRDGLAYLIRTQARDGNLFGGASHFAQTYCHSMASFALAEAYALTGDERLENSVRRAVDFLVARQDRTTGGWRYGPGDPGDMSQLGWILMALRSAEIAGVEIPPQTWEGIERFVQSTQRGRNGGLACYRANSPPSHSMTAESFYCRQILGRPIAGATAVEAVDGILRHSPGQGRVNLYAWYYATLALHHHRRFSSSSENAWREWNEAMKRALLASQVSDGMNKGSWSPNTVWGSCGGRVYSTALATMCLEVYYRYDSSGLARDPWIAAREYPARLR